MQGQFLQFVNIQTVDGLNIFYGMGMIKAVTPGIKCTSRIIPCAEVTVEDVAIAKVGIHFYKNVDQAQDKYNRDERSYAIIILDINEQAAHMYSNTLAEEAMKLFDNLMKHEAGLADVVVVLFNVSLTVKVIWRWGHGLKSHLTDW